MSRTRRTPLIYSDKFRNRVLEAYPDNPHVKELLDNNTYSLGRYLDDGSYGNVSAIEPETIIEKIESGYVDELLVMAKSKLEEVRKHRLKIEVYSMWNKEVFID